ncbi:hypothetical protein SAMN05421788_10893 [Filimonas lacunae]|uniref:Uncharacterized protein n=1 Tax=Filimonas lacunae TaxID=477680 RepID=A0A173MDV0_9BACT|nr:hypothetical protein [Filimonas lacunae]BAV05764.1 hypothetical protein FLA_1776 [Filimonas lacunae]SIT28687.1 hypothetical protein SAMN05421788_10893 [Filimonas lacunae]
MDDLLLMAVNALQPPSRRGYLYAGKIKKVGNQWIETRFATGLLIPTHSIIVMAKTGWRKREGFFIRLSWQSILAYYMRMITAAFALVSLGFLLDDIKYASRSEMATGISYCLVFGGLYMYFRLFFAKPKEKEIVQRTKLGKAIGLYAKPEWLDDMDAIELLKALRDNYTLSYGSDWAKDLDSESIEPAKIPFLYGLAVIDNRICATEIGKQRLDRIDALFVI